MTDNANFTAPSEAAATPTTSPAPSQPSPLYKIFFGPNGLRAGWRFAIFVLVMWALIVSIRFVRHHFFHVQPLPPLVPGSTIPPGTTLYSKVMGFLIPAVAALIMTRIEPSKWGDFGLPIRRAVSLDFWFGCLWGFGGLSFLMGALWLAGAYRIDGLALAGIAIWKYALAWGLVFLFVGLGEEFVLRGYPLYTLASGISFWPAAVVMSGLFMAGHIKNPGENWMGLTDVFLIGMFLCFTLWRTGDLWFAVGMHTAWDWGLSYFYSVPDSGMVSAGHLFNIRSMGPDWLTGGSAGPEGSLLNLILDLVFFALFALIYRKRKWIGMDDRRKTTRTLAPSPTPVMIDTSALSS